jgi:murein L,D-transpeptidase YcbB/YkuD
MCRMGLSFVSRAFTAFALVICFYSFFISSEMAIKTQAIYWFCGAVVSAVIPYLKEVAAYVQSIKLGDVEIALNEVKHEIQRVDNKVEKLDNKLLASLGQVRQSEAALTREARENRQRIYDESAQALALLPPEIKINLQKRLTLNHLEDAGIDIQTLKKLFKDLGYYQGAVDEFFNPGLVQAIEEFQVKNIPGQPDGIVGPITLFKIAELHS